MSFTQYFTLDYYMTLVGYTKASRLEVIKGEQVTDEDIERINIDFARKTREAIRWLGANAPDIGAIVNADISGIIGSSVNIQSRIKGKTELNEQIEDFIDDWSIQCEVSGRWHLNSALRSMVEFTDKDGGFLLRHHYNTSWNIPYKFEIFEVGMIDIGQDDEKNNLLNGIQRGEYGEITGIYIYKNQDRDKSTLIPYNSLTFFSPVWISLSQYTAVSKLASILPTIDKLEQYSDAELQKVIEEAKAGKYWKTSMYDDLMKILKATKDEDTRKLQLSTLMKTISESGIKPNGLTPIPLGDDVVKTDSVSASVYPNITNVGKQNIGASQGLSSQIVYQDSSDSNYSSIKAMMAFASITWNIRYDDLEAMVIKPMLKNLIRTGVDVGAINAPDYYKNPRKYFKLEIMRVTEIDIEPAKTANADSTKLESGTISKREICRRRGRNYENVLNEILEDEELENRLRKEKNLELEEEVSDGDTND